MPQEKAPVERTTDNARTVALAFQLHAKDEVLALLAAPRLVLHHVVAAAHSPIALPVVSNFGQTSIDEPSWISRFVRRTRWTKQEGRCQIRRFWLYQSARDSSHQRPLLPSAQLSATAICPLHVAASPAIEESLKPKLCSVKTAGLITVIVQTVDLRTAMSDAPAPYGRPQNCTPSVGPKATCEQPKIVSRKERHVPRRTCGPCRLASHAT